METITLNNGVVMPIIGYGTYQTPPDMTEQCVDTALSLGYRSIDTAQCYGNEREVGLACRSSGVPRNQLFITTKLWGCRGYEDTLRSIDGSLKRLNMDYIDLMLIHEPTGDVHEIYRAMETVSARGHIRAIGISNFLEKQYLDLTRLCTVIPAVNQVENHVFRQQQQLRTLERRTGTLHESWSPLACGRHDIWKHPMLSGIASRYEKSVAQIALRFLTQQDIIVIPKSTDMRHMRENLDSLNFHLTPEELQALKTLDEGRSLFGWW